MFDFGSIFYELEDFLAPIVALSGGALLGALTALGIRSLVQFIYTVINGIAMIFVSKKLGVKNGWFAFIPPFLAPYLYGRLAEESDKIRRPHKEARKWGSTMLKLHFPAIIAFAVTVIAAIVLFILTRVGVMNETIAAVVVLALAFVTVVLDVAQSIALAVLGYVVRYKLYNCFGRRHCIWMILTDLFIGDFARLVIAILLGFTPIFKGHLRKTVEPTV